MILSIVEICWGKHNIPLLGPGATSALHEPCEFPRALEVDKVSVVIEEVRIAAEETGRVHG